MNGAGSNKYSNRRGNSWTRLSTSEYLITVGRVCWIKNTNNFVEVAQYCTHCLERDLYLYPLFVHEKELIALAWLNINLWENLSKSLLQKFLSFWPKNNVLKSVFRIQGIYFFIFLHDRLSSSADQLIEPARNIKKLGRILLTNVFSDAILHQVSYIQWVGSREESRRFCSSSQIFAKKLKKELKIWFFFEVLFAIDLLLPDAHWS